MKVTGEVNKKKISFVSGQMIPAGAVLFKITGRKSYLDDARKTAAGCHKMFFVPCTDDNGKAFSILQPGDIWSHAIMLRGLTDLYDADGDPTYVNDVRKSLEYAWNHAKSSSGLFKIDMSGQDEPNRYSLITQAAMAEMYARMGEMLDND